MASTSGGEGFVSSLSGEALEKAKTELFEDPETRGENILELRGRIEAWRADPENEAEGLSLSREDDGLFLLRFLRARKFDIERALLLYLSFHRYREKYAHIFVDYTPQAVEHVLKSGLLTVLERRALNGAKIILLQPAFWDHENVPFQDNFRALMLLLDRLIEDEETQVCGVMVINNLNDTSFLTVMKVARSEQMQRGLLFELLQDAFPLRFKGIHLVNQPWYISMVLAIVRPFMKQKLRDRLFIHGVDYGSLQEHVAPASLPMELGGELPPYHPHNAWLFLSGGSPEA